MPARNRGSNDWKADLFDQLGSCRGVHGEHASAAGGDNRQKPEGGRDDGGKRSTEAVEAALGGSEWRRLRRREGAAGARSASEEASRRRSSGARVAGDASMGGRFGRAKVEGRSAGDRRSKRSGRPCRKA